MYLLRVLGAYLAKYLSTCIMSLRLKGIVIVYLPLKKKISDRKDFNQYFFLLFTHFFVNVDHCDKASLPGSPRKKFYRRLSIR